MTLAEGYNPFLLADYEGREPPAPTWYCDAMRQCPEPSIVDVEGAAIEYLVWGDVGKPGLLLVHGGLANAHWWAHIGPMLASDYRVAALSLSGMGHSGHRPHYSMALYAEELRAVASAARLNAAGPPVVAGHSFGVAPTLVAIADPQSWVRAAILIEGDPIAIGKGAPLAMRRPHRKPFATRKEGIARYRLMPPQPCDHAYIVDGIARRSLRATEEGYAWAFDPDLGNKMEISNARARLSCAQRPMAILYGEESQIITTDVLEQLRSEAPASTPVIGLAKAGHHVMLDQPLETVAALRDIMARWR